MVKDSIFLQLVKFLNENLGFRIHIYVYIVVKQYNVLFEINKT